jgi:putative ATPase
LAIGNAQALVKETGNLPVPLALRNAPTKLMKELNYGKGYLYAHDFEGNFAAQHFLPDDVQGKKLFDPQENIAEDKIRQKLKKDWHNYYDY